ncbi:MAG: DUF6143 family protein [Clostridium sp.]
MSKNDYLANKEISISYPLYQSQNGKYFIGETPILSGQDSHALAALVNPSDSNVNIYVNAITVTNISPKNISAEIYLNAIFTGGLTSTSVACVNTSFNPPPKPYGQIKFLPTTATPPIGGTSIFSRIVSPNSTNIIDGSQIIIGPGKSLIVYLGGYLPISPNSTIVALGWWEETTNNYCNKCYNNYY